MLEEIQLQQVLPQEIEKRSFEIITEELGNVELDPLQAPIIKRAIHTSADFDYLKNLTFSELAVEQFHTAIKLAKYGGEVYCFMSDDDVAEIAKKQGSTRAVASMEKACMLDKPLIFAIGNAPTALVRLYELIDEGKLHPCGIIGVPVGFVNVVEAKELIMRTPVPYIVARGRKGGSNIAAAICNALLYELRDMEK